jgi:membrane-associated phospholipid phosphatase
MMIKKKIYPFDILIIGYLLFISLLILLLGRPLSEYYDELLLNIVVIGLVCCIIVFLHRTEYRIIHFFRILYPCLLFGLFYEQTGGLMKLFFPNFLDYQLTAFEQAIFGIEPTLWLDNNLINVWITEILSMCYFSYYLMLPTFLIALYFMKRYDIIKRALTAICLTFFISYLLFFLYPIEGPRYFFDGQYIHNIAGPIFRPLVDLAIEKGAVHGGCMPSTHVAVALVMLISIAREYRWTGWFLIPLNIGLAMGTVYGRFHYVSDVIVGTVIGISMISLTLKYYNKFDPDSFKSFNNNAVEKYYVS